MVGDEACTVEDVYRYAMPSGALARPTLNVASVDTAGNVLEALGHGCSTDDPVEFRVFPGGTLPAPLVEGVVYYAKPVTDSDDLLQVAAAAGGSAIDLTSVGSDFGIAPSIRPILHAQIRAGTHWVYQRLPAHTVPLTPDTNGNYPEVVRRMVAIIAAFNTLALLGQKSTQLDAMMNDVRENAGLMLSGLPLRDVKATSQIPITRGVDGITARGTDIIP